MKFFLVVIFFFNCIFTLTAESNQKLKAKNAFIEIQNVENADFVLFTKHPKLGSEFTKIFKLEKQIISNSQPIVFFYREKLKYFFDKDKNLFKKIKPHLSRPILDFMNKPANLFDSEIEAQLIENNVLHFPLPSFIQIFKEQMIDPLNFFQIFSVALWFFDNNFYHPLMMIFLLLISNSSVCIQRITTILNLRSMQTKPYIVKVFDKKSNSFIKKSSEELFPGDIIQVTSSKEMKEFENNNKNENYLLEEIRAQFPFGNKIPPQFFEKLIKTKDSDQRIVNSVDLLIIEGSLAVDESILTGENLPQVKENVFESDQQNLQEEFNSKRFKNSVVFAGTDILLTHLSNKKDDKVLGVVLNTGFMTTKGKLARKVLFNDESHHISQRDAYILLTLLLVVSIISSLIVLFEGLKDETRSKEKLFIRCILIVTSVVPPELPMIMAMAVNNSILYLRNKKIFCTEPFRIPLAGKIESCVFDKTGTLTQETLKFKGFANYQQDENLVLETDLKNDKMQNYEKLCAILGGCHSLIEINKTIQGDPIELIFFGQTEFKYDSSNKKTFNSKNQNQSIKIKQVFNFSSELKRMSAIVQIKNFQGLDGDYLVTKGAPEVIENLLSQKIPKYNEWVTKLACDGFRILSLAIRNINDINSKDRKILENNLTFIGFLVLFNELKKDTIHYIKKLKDAERDIVILTGDHLLTSLQTFSSIGFNSKEKAIISYQNDTLQLTDLKQQKLNTDDYQKYYLSITGEYLNKFLLLNPELIQYVSVVARVDPKQKEFFISKLKVNKKVLMCGDGTNDVGALKTSDVGIALVGNRDEPSKQMKEELKIKKQNVMRKALQERRMPKPEELTFEMEEADFKLGDASIAAPFTNKHSNSIKCVEVVLKQGVATLACGIQSYKIVTLSSLLAAYSLSSLHLENLKFSDMQNTLMGVYGAYLYFALSNGKPVKDLPKEKPDATIFNRYFWSSLLGQFALQFMFLVRCMSFAKQYAPESDKDVNNEDEFVPTFTNSVMFLYNLASMFCISIFNYEGRPYMISLSENKKHFKFLIFPILIIFILIFNIFEWLTDFFQTKFITNVPCENLLALYIFGFIISSYLWTILIKFIKNGKIIHWI